MEEWKDINGYIGLYQISNQGRVKSLRFGKEKILKLSISEKGYLMVTIHLDGKQTCKVHRLVAQAFIDNSLDLPQVNHKDGDKTNNNDWNLEWCTPKENTGHAITTGLRNNSGIKHPLSKLTEITIINIRQSKLTKMELAKQYNVTVRCINNVINRKTWKHI